jgi:hypothetical protein
MNSICFRRISQSCKQRLRDLIKFQDELLVLKRRKIEPSFMINLSRSMFEKC